MLESLLNKVAGLKIEEQALDHKTGKYFQKVYDFHRLIKVKENRDRTEKFDAKVDRCKKCLTDSLEIGEKVLVLDALGRLYKSTTENKSFF